MWDYQHHLGIDVVEFFTLERSWFEFWLLFQQLPQESRVKASIADNPELAKMKAAAIPDEQIEAIINGKSEDPQERTVPLEGYTPEMAKLDDLINEVRILRLTFANAFSKKKIEEPMQPRPKDAFMKELEARMWQKEKEEADELKSKLGF